MNLKGNNRKCYSFGYAVQLFDVNAHPEPGPILDNPHRALSLEECTKRAADRTPMGVSGSWPHGAPEGVDYQIARICEKLNKGVILDGSEKLLKISLDYTPTGTKP